MADIEEKGDRGIRGRSENISLQLPDAQAARVAGASEVRAFQGLNKNAHNGSAGGDQHLSFELVAIRDDGVSNVVAARQSERLESISMEELIVKGRSGDKFAASIVQQMRAAADLPEKQRNQTQAKLQDTADRMYGRSAGTDGHSEQSKRLESIDTQTMKALAPSNEVARSALEMRANIEKHVPAGQERDRLIAQLKADVTPVLKEHVEQNVYRDQEPNEWQAFNRLDSKQQRAIIEAFQMGSDIGQEAYEKQIQAVAESVPKGFYNVGKSLYDTGAAAGTFVIESAQRPEKVPEAAQKLSESLSTAMISGVKISQVVASYGQETAQSGDYSRPLRDLQAVTILANERWEATPLEKRTEKASELIANIGLGSVIGAADRLAKSGKLIDALEDLAKYGKDLTAPGREKARQALGSFLDDVFQPKAVTPDGRKIAIPQESRDNYLMSKADDLGSQSGRLVNTGMDATGKALAFSKESGIELGAARLGQDGVWQEVPIVRGNEIHVGLFENLPTGTKTIDRVVIKDGIAESIKSIDPRLDSYLEPSTFRNKLNSYVQKMQDYEGQPSRRAGFQIRKDDIDQKILHFGIPDGALTPQQIKVLEDLGRQVLKDNALLPPDQVPLKIKVTVLK